MCLSVGIYVLWMSSSVGNVRFGAVLLFVVVVGVGCVWAFVAAARAVG